MSELLYKKNNFEIMSWDIVKLTDGKIVGIIGTECNYSDVNEETKLIISTTPISSYTSTCKIKHISEIIEHCGCFDNQIDWLMKNMDLIRGNELYINLED